MADRGGEITQRLHDSSKHRWPLTMLTPNQYSNSDRRKDFTHTHTRPHPPHRLGSARSAVDSHREYICSLRRRSHPDRIGWCVLSSARGGAATPTSVRAGQAALRVARGARPPMRDAPRSNERLKACTSGDNGACLETMEDSNDAKDPSSSRADARAADPFLKSGACRSAVATTCCATLISHATTSTRF